MIIENIVGNLETIDIGQRHVERVYIPGDDLLKRIQLVTTDHHRQLGIRLRQAQELSDGDVLYMDEQTVIVVDVLPDELLVIRPQTLKEMGEIAHQLGNRHLPAQFEGEEMLVQYDPLVEELLQRLGTPYAREKRKIKQAFRPVGHRHG